MDATKGTILNFVNMVDNENTLPETEKDLLSEVMSLTAVDEQGRELLAITNAIAVANLTISDNTELAEKAKELAASMDMDEEVIQFLIELMKPCREEMV